MATPQVTVSDEGKIGLSLFNDGQETVFNPFTGNINFKRKNLFSGILDEIPGAAFALSSQLLSRDFLNQATYAPVRRTSDNVEANVKIDQSVDPKRITLDSPIIITSGSSAATTLGELVNELVAEEVTSTATADNYATAPSEISITGSLNVSYGLTVDGESSVADIEASGATSLRFEPALSIWANVGDTIRFTGRARQDTSSGNTTVAWLRLYASEQGPPANSQPVLEFPSQDAWFDFDVSFVSTIKGIISLEIGRAGAGYFISTGFKMQIANLEIERTSVASDAALVTGFDQSGNGNDATQLTTNSQPLIVEAGVLLDGIKFDGTDDNLAVADFAPTVDATLCAWVNPNAADTVGYIFAINNPATAGEDRINIAWVGNSDVIRISRRTATGGNHDSDPVFDDTDWTFVTIAVSGREISFYKNGVAAGTATASDDFVLTPGTLRIGSRDGAVLFGGLINHAMIFQRELSPSEITAIMEATDPR